MGTKTQHTKNAIALLGGDLEAVTPGALATLKAGVAGGPTTVLKTADEAVTSSTALQDDGQLTLALAASTKYFFKFFLRITTANATPDMKVSLNGPATPTAFWAYIMYGNASNGAFESGASGGLITAYNAVASGGRNWGSAADTMIVIQGYIETAASVAQNLVLRWAQRVSNAGATTVKAGSWMEVTKAA